MAPRRPSRSSPGAQVADIAEVGRDVDALLRALAEHAIPVDALARSRLIAYASALLRWNDRINFVSRRDAANIVSKHFGASAAVMLLVQPGRGERWADVGSGAGFPGLVLRILAPTQHIELIESSKKKCTFLESVVRDLELGPVPIHAMRAETLSARLRPEERFDLVICRAVASLQDSVRNFGPLVLTSGRLLTYKGTAWEQELNSADSTMHEHRFRLERTAEPTWAPAHLLLLARD